MPQIDLSILNQRQTPAFYASSLATRPAFGFAGRIFIDTDSPSTGLYRDTGAAWVQIADPGAGTTGTLQQVTTNGNTTTNDVILTAPAKLQIGALYNTLFPSGPFLLDLTISGDDAINFLTDNNATDQGGFLQGGGFYTNYNVGIKTNTPNAALDVHSDVSGIAHLNQTVLTNNSLLNFQNSGSGLWRIGSFYNAGANDFGIFDVIGSAQPITVKKTTGQVLIGTSTVGSGKLVVASATGDNGVQIVGASAPSLRIDNAETGPTKRAGFGISTATNNFIQGSADRDFCMFNGSTTASPILFGIYDTTNVQEAARISAARNFLVGNTTDNGYKLQVSGVGYFSNGINVNNTIGTEMVSINNVDNSSRQGIRLNNGINSSSGIVVFNSALSTGTTTGGLLIVDQASSSLSQPAVVIAQAGSADFIRCLGPSSSLKFNVSSAGDATFSNSVTTTQLNATTTIAGYAAILTNTNGAADSNGLLVKAGSIGTEYNVRFANQTDTSTFFTIKGNGNVLVNTLTDAGQKLQVNGTGYFADNVYIGNTTISTASPAIFLQKSGLITNVYNYTSGTINLFEFYKIGAAIGTISYDGTLVLYNSTSDYRLKQDYKDYNGLDLVNKIKTYDYEWKENKKRGYGVIAHELQSVIDYAVTGEKDGKEMQQVDYSKLVPVLIKAIQELNTKIENLK